MASKADTLKKKMEQKAAGEDTKAKNTSIDEKMDSMVKGSKIAPKPQPIEKKRPKKETHKTFTTWVEKEKLASWKAYIATKGIKSEDLALYAIQHYIDTVYPITKDEMETYKQNLEAELSNIDKDARKK